MFLIVEVEEEELLALKEAIPVMPLSEELRHKLEEAIRDAENDPGL